VSIRYRQAEPADAEAIAQVHVDSWYAAYASFVPTHVLEARSVKDLQVFWKTALEKQPESVIVAENDAGDIVGWISFGICKDEPDTAELFAIYNRPDHFRSGVGTGLWQFARQRLQETGLSVVKVLVFTQATPARRFYESVGFKLVEGSESVFEWHGENLEDVRYEYRFDDA